MTRRTFGDLDGPPLRRPALPPDPREDLDHVAAALESEYEPDELDQLAEQVRHFVTGDDESPANRLHAQLRAAADAAAVPDPPAPPSPAGDPVAFQLFAEPEGGEPLEVVLGGGERVTTVPAGRSDWRLVHPPSATAEVFARPVP